MSWQVENSMMVVTRTQAMRQLQEGATTRSKDCESGANLHGIVKVPEELTCIGREFDDEIFSTSQEKAKPTKPNDKRGSHVNSIMKLVSKIPYRNHWKYQQQN